MTYSAYSECALSDCIFRLLLLLLEVIKPLLLDTMARMGSDRDGTDRMEGGAGGGTERVELRTTEGGSEEVKEEDEEEEEDEEGVALDSSSIALAYERLRKWRG